MVSNKIEYTNRHGNIINFIVSDPNTIYVELPKGESNYTRVLLQNDYNFAYNKYKREYPEPHLSLKEFKIDVHKWVEMDDETSAPGELYDKYASYVEGTTNIDAFDPSGGPYISIDMDLKNIIGVKAIIEKIVPHKNGYILKLKDSEIEKKWSY